MRIIRVENDLALRLTLLWVAERILAHHGSVQFAFRFYTVRLLEVDFEKGRGNPNLLIRWQFVVFIARQALLGVVTFHEYLERSVLILPLQIPKNFSQIIVCFEQPEAGAH